MSIGEPFEFRANGRDVMFEPRGALYSPTTRRLKVNRLDWSDTTGKTPSARIIVGFNPGKECAPKRRLKDRESYLMQDLIDIVHDVRLRHVAKADSTFIAQRGTFTHENGDEADEDGAQVVMFPVENENPEQFFYSMQTLAETIAVELAQDLVILDYRIGNVTTGTYGFSCSDAKR